MTLILATNHGIFSDRKITADTGETCDPMKKFASNDVIVAAFAGDVETILKAMDMVKEGIEDPREIAKIDVEGLVVKNGRIYVLDLKKAWLKPKRCAYWAMGTGGTVAMAFLSGRTSRTGKLTEKDIKDAFKYTSRARTDCGPKADFLQAW
jgi:hypothetical protein